MQAAQPWGSDLDFFRPMGAGFRSLQCSHQYKAGRVRTWAAAQAKPMTMTMAARNGNAAIPMTVLSTLIGRKRRKVSLEEGPGFVRCFRCACGKDFDAGIPGPAAPTVRMERQRLARRISGVKSREVRLGPCPPGLFRRRACYRRHALVASAVASQVPSAVVAISCRGQRRWCA